MPKVCGSAEVTAAAPPCYSAPMRPCRPALLLFRLTALTLALLLSSQVRADGRPLIGSVPLAVSSQCGFLGDCAHTDAIGLHLGTTAAVRFTGSRNQVGLTGLIHGSLTFLELVELGGAIGGHYAKDEAGSSQAATAPALLFVKLRLYPLVWQRASPGGLQLSASYQRSLVSESLGSAEQPGFDLNTARLLAKHQAFTPVAARGLSRVIVWRPADIARRRRSPCATPPSRCHDAQSRMRPSQR